MWVFFRLVLDTFDLRWLQFSIEIRPCLITNFSFVIERCLRQEVSIWEDRLSLLLESVQRWIDLLLDLCGNPVDLLLSRGWKRCPLLDLLLLLWLESVLRRFKIVSLVFILFVWQKLIVDLLIDLLQSLLAMHLVREVSGEHWLCLVDSQRLFELIPYLVQVLLFLLLVDQIELIWILLSQLIFNLMQSDNV